MKKNKTVKHNGKLTTYALLNAVGGAVRSKLNWEYNKEYKIYMAQHFTIQCSSIQEKWKYSLGQDVHIGVFRKLSRAKLVAELINNG